MENAGGGLGSGLWAHCSDVTDCFNCTTAISGCHWCGDQTCSVYGSPHCLIGQTCASPPDCIRAAPEFSGYEAPPAKAVVLFIFISIIVMASFVCCLWCCLSMWDRRRLAALKKRVNERRQAEDRAEQEQDRDRRSVQLSEMPAFSASARFRDSLASDAAAAGSSSTRVLGPPRVTVTSIRSTRAEGGGGDLKESLLEGKSDESDAASPTFALRMHADGTAEVTPATAAVSPAPLPFPPPLPPLPRKQRALRSCAFGVTVMAITGTLVCLIVVCLLYPHLPQYSLCNRDIQWGTLLQNMASFSLSVNVDLHLAVWNPNRFHLLLNRIDARILYGADIVGTGSQYNISFDAGNINDFIMTVVFAPSLPSATAMLRDHMRGQLLLDVLFDLDTSVLIGELARPLIQLNTSYVIEGIDAEGAEERQYCKCVNPAAGDPPPKSGAAAFLALASPSHPPPPPREQTVLRTQPISGMLRVHNLLPEPLPLLLDGLSEPDEEGATALEDAVPSDAPAEDAEHA